MPTEGTGEVSEVGGPTLSKEGYGKSEIMRGARPRWVYDALARLPCLG